MKNPKKTTQGFLVRFLQWTLSLKPETPDPKPSDPYRPHRTLRSLDLETLNPKRSLFGSL